MKNLPLIIGVFLALALGFCMGQCNHSRSSPDNIDSIVRDTIIDTITYRLPIPVDSVVIRYKTVKLPVADSVFTKRDDTIKIDSVYVEVPIQQKEYQDSTFHAWVSGFNVNLDSISVFPKTIIETHRIRQPPKRWGLGIQLGTGYYGDKRIFSPYIGIGISYNILTW